MKFQNILEIEMDVIIMSNQDSCFSWVVLVERIIGGENMLNVDLDYFYSWGLLVQTFYLKKYVILS